MALSDCGFLYVYDYNALGEVIGGLDMIFLFSGTPGSGKSLHAADIVYHRLKLGKPVITNYPLSVDSCRTYKNRKVQHIETHNHYSKKGEKMLPWVKDKETDTYALTPEFLVAYSRKYFGNRKVVEDEILLCIDEAQLMFNARQWSMAGRDKWNSFFSNHRKFGYKIILMAQFDRMLDSQIRSLIEYEVVHRKLLNFGWRGLLLSALFLSPRMHVAVKVWYPMREKVGSEFFKFKKFYSKMYDTYRDFTEI